MGPLVVSIRDMLLIQRNFTLPQPPPPPPPTFLMSSAAPLSFLFLYKISKYKEDKFVN